MIMMEANNLHFPYIGTSFKGVDNMSKKNSDVLAKENMSLAYWVANKWYKKSSIPLDELQSAALLGLAKASLSYDESRATSFATYSTLIMENEIKRSMEKYIKTVGSFHNSGTKIEDISTGTEDDIHDNIALAYALNNLPEESRIIFLSVYKDGLTQKEVARRHGLTEKQIRRELDEIKEFLRHQMNS